MQFGAYTVERELGAGGMSQVWLARAPTGGLIVLKRQLNRSDDDRLRMEGRLGLRLRHPGIVQTLDVFEHEGRPLLALEYVAGAPLALLRKLGALAPEAVCRIGADIAEALAALHSAVDEAGQPARILHRDVSPANIIVSPDGRARLIDLGIARTTDSGFDRTRTGDLRGTVRYLAPELFEGAAHSPKSDLWALGVCLFEAALGRPAATGSEAVLLARIVQGRLFSLSEGERLPQAIDDVLSRLCAPVDARVGDAVEAAWILSQAERAIGDGRSAARVSVFATLEDRAQAQPTEPIRPASAARPAADLGEDAFLRFAASTYLANDDEDPFATVAATAVTPNTGGGAGSNTAGGAPSGSSTIPSGIPSGIPSATGPNPPAETAPNPIASGRVGPASGEGAPVGEEIPPTALWTPSADMVSRPDGGRGALPLDGAQWTLPPPTTGSGGGDTAPEKPANEALAHAPTRLSAAVKRPFAAEASVEPATDANPPAPPPSDPAAVALTEPPQSVDTIEASPVDPFPAETPEAVDPLLAELMGSSRTPWAVVAGAAAVLAVIVLLALWR